MTNEEMERTIQFIVQQQTQFASDMQQMRWFLMFPKN